MSDETVAKRTRNDDPIEFDIVERPVVAAKRVGPRSSKWQKVVEAAQANEGKYVHVRKIGTRSERSVMAALTGFAKRHPDLLNGKRLRTATNPEGGVFVWIAEPTEKQSELPLETTAAA